MKRIFTKFSVLTFLCLLFINAAFAQNITVKGVVTDGQDKSTIPSVSVMVKGTTTGAQTDVAGRYTISAPANATLVFTYVGYITKEVPVNNQSTINVVLNSSSQDLEQVVVVGYGTQRKIDVTGAVATVKGEDISKQASTNPVSALQGKVAGVSISNNGAPGSAPQITIRGTGTVYGNTSVLYVVDGVWFDDINFLNPADIESISILKDASSLSIYGIRAANGVVLVTTSKGKKGDPVINYNGSIGFQSVTNAVKMANGTEFATMINELSTSAGNAPLFKDPSIYGKGTDWYGQVLRNAMVTNHQLSINGGTEKSSYNFSLGYLNQDGIVKNNNYKRYTARLSNDFQLYKFLKIGYNVAGTASKSNDINNSIFHQIYAAGPIVPVYYADGTYGDPNDFGLGGGNNFNPQVTLDFYNNVTKNYRLTGNVYAELNILKNLTFKTSAGGDFGQLEARGYSPVYKATQGQQNDISLLNIDRTEDRNWIIENTLTYKNTFGDHNLTVLAGQTAQRYKQNYINGTARNVPFSSEGDLYLALGDAGTRTVTNTGSLRTATSYFGRVNYSFKDRYLLNASFRADAASQFYGGGELWGYFPSIGAGWVISNEPFMKDQTVFSNLKLRGSWGKIGNAGVPSNPTTLTVSQPGGYVIVFNGVAYTGKSIDTAVPTFLNWERGVGTDIGLEAGFLNNRLNIEADYYIKKTQNAIFGIPVRQDIGLKDSKLIGNQADFENKGFELLATWKDKTDGGLTYSISGNFGYNKNKVTSVVTGLNPIYGGGDGLTNGALATRTVLGGSIGEFYGYKVAGVFQNTAEIAKSAQPNAIPGDFKYVDQNGDGVIDGKDRVSLGSPNPKFSYGLNTNFAYKNFDLTIDIQGVAGVDVYNANLGLRYGNENFTKDFYDHRWHGEGTSNTYPSTNIGSGANSAPNSFFVESGAYIRVRNLQLGYTLPKALMGKWKMQRIRVFANAQNPINLFGYKGFSPEIGKPTVGTYSPLSRGIDANVYPLYATYNLGVNVTF
ncbi:SusC/RagA family TonB-linked outer membrane protein [Pedobacter nutrimenti]|jgi:TonB-linked SusC/RagA family outer membrane protein|uniref:TonB-linked SusC/RagA family outer membrane protein n=1 Tax=Pedobacter nutrimenti TaxID=1241337 RepID=A0A318U784_9SPHI|nr:TonB-dependent receptor [Pedobacter nutrimenti]PYF69928.1 TonB-linked SusC/RagA family outer membrane protein [Pedobacter nutrimenti]